MTFSLVKSQINRKTRLEVITQLTVEIIKLLYLLK